MEIKFYWNGGIVGPNYNMIVNGKKIRLGDNLEVLRMKGDKTISNENEAKLEAIRILKRDYKINYNIEDISFSWGGQL